MAESSQKRPLRKHPKRPPKDRKGRTEIRVPAEILQKAKDISQKTGIELKQALRVAKGQTTVSAVLKELMIQDKADKIQNKQGVTRNLAIDVARGKMNLDDAVLIHQLHNSEAWVPNHSFLIQLNKRDEIGFFQTFGEEPFTAKVTELTKYDCLLARDDQEPKEYQKHDILFAAHPQIANNLESLKKIDKEVKALELGPSKSYRDRFRSKKRDLFRLHRDDTKVKVTLRDGTVFVGKVGWFGKWEFLLGLSDGDDCDVVIFRHALHRMEALDPVSPQEKDVQKQADKTKSEIEEKKDTVKEENGEGSCKKTATTSKTPKKKKTKTKKKKKKKKR